MKKKARLNLFTALGWLVWKILALVGLPYAKNRLAHIADDKSARSYGLGGGRTGFLRRRDRA